MNRPCPLVIVLLYTALSVHGQIESKLTHSVAVQKLSLEQIATVTDSISELITRHYVNKTNAAKIVNDFSAAIRSEKYNVHQTKGSLARAISEDLRKWSGDGHLFVQALDRKQNAPTVDWEAAERGIEIKTNFGFTEIRIMEDNVGYLKIQEFMHPKRTMPTAVSAMQFLENTRAMIIDLRGNGGGYPGIMEYILNHYFDGEPVLLSKTMHSDESYTTTYSSDLVVGRLRVNQPLYILIDKRTASATEYFAYTLQAFKKAVVIGERSAGGANRNQYFDLPEGLRISISVASPVSAVTHTNWEGVGVIPDIESVRPIEIALELSKTSRQGNH